jgi:hypothetical protein
MGQGDRDAAGAFGVDHRDQWPCRARGRPEPADLAPDAERDHDRARGRACPGVAADRAEAGWYPAALGHVRRDVLAGPPERAGHHPHHVRRVRVPSGARGPRRLAPRRPPRHRGTVAAARAARRHVPGDPERVRGGRRPRDAGGGVRGEPADLRRGPGRVQLRDRVVPAARRDPSRFRAEPGSVAFPAAGRRTRRAKRRRSARPADRGTRRPMGAHLRPRGAGRARSRNEAPDPSGPPRPGPANRGQLIPRRHLSGLRGIMPCARGAYSTCPSCPAASCTGSAAAAQALMPPETFSTATPRGVGVVSA